MIPTDNLSTLARDIESRFITSLQGAALSPDEQSLVNRISARLAQYGLSAIGAPPAVQNLLKVYTDFELSSLALIGAAKELQVEQAMRQAAYDALTAAAGIGLKVLIGALAAV